MINHLKRLFSKDKISQIDIIINDVSTNEVKLVNNSNLDVNIKKINIKKITFKES